MKELTKPISGIPTATSASTDGHIGLDRGLDRIRRAEQDHDPGAGEVLAAGEAHRRAVVAHPGWNHRACLIGAVEGDRQLGDGWRRENRLFLA